MGFTQVIATQHVFDQAVIIRGVGDPFTYIDVIQHRLGGIHPQATRPLYHRVIAPQFMDIAQLIGRGIGFFMPQLRLNQTKSVQIPFLEVLLGNVFIADHPHANFVHVIAVLIIFVAVTPPIFPNVLEGDAFALLHLVEVIRPGGRLGFKVKFTDKVIVHPVIILILHLCKEMRRTGLQAITWQTHHVQQLVITFRHFGGDHDGVVINFLHIINVVVEKVVVPRVNDVF